MLRDTQEVANPIIRKKLILLRATKMTIKAESLDIRRRLRGYSSECNTRFYGFALMNDSKSQYCGDNRHFLLVQYFEQPVFVISQPKREKTNVGTLLPQNEFREGGKIVYLPLDQKELWDFLLFLGKIVTYTGRGSADYSLKSLKEYLNER